jgi:anti-sigma regulatory factor (Ser/Thr protein kinase)
MGLRMMEQLMDAVAVEQTPTGTTVHMRKASNGDERL